MFASFLLTSDQLSTLLALLVNRVYLKSWHFTEQLSTLPADMFDVSEYWLETSLIIKISTHPC